MALHVKRDKHACMHTSKMPTCANGIHHHLHSFPSVMLCPADHVYMDYVPVCCEVCTYMNVHAQAASTTPTSFLVAAVAGLPADRGLLPVIGMEATWSVLVP